MISRIHFTYRWRDELQRKKHDSRLADQSITILLHNILPAHVGMVLLVFGCIEHPIISFISCTVNVFISSEAKHELYYEEFENVSIMFASLKDFELDLSNLRVLNEIITEFDKVVRCAMIFIRFAFYSDLASLAASLLQGGLSCREDQNCELHLYGSLWFGFQVH